MIINVLLERIHINSHTDKNWQFSVLLYVEARSLYIFYSPGNKNRVPVKTEMSQIFLYQASLEKHNC